MTMTTGAVAACTQHDGETKKGNPALREAPQQERLIRASEFMGLLGIKKTKFYTAKKEGKIPSAVPLTKRSKAWPSSVVARVIEDIKSGRLSL